MRRGCICGISEGIKPSIDQQLVEAYDTLYDENRRILYDAKYKFSRRWFPRTRNEIPSIKETKRELREMPSKASGEREWAERERVVTEDITRLKKKVERINADMEEYDRLGRERFKKQRSR